MEDPGVAGRVEQGSLAYLFAIFWGKYPLVPAERYCVDTGTGVYLHCQVLCAGSGW